MVNVMPSAVSKLKTLILEHPEDPIVRLTIRDVDDTRLAFSITLESDAQTDDEVHECDGLTVAVEARSAVRMNGIILDYEDAGGFKFFYPDHGSDDLPGIVSLN